MRDGLSFGWNFYFFIYFFQVCFNPNFGSFTHLAVGYHCGLVRLITLDKLQKDSHLVRFFKKEAF